jgi:hypothetical protein
MEIDFIHHQDMFLFHNLYSVIYSAIFGSLLYSTNIAHKYLLVYKYIP